MQEHVAGTELELDAASGSLQITVVDVDELDQDGGALTIGTETIAYTVPEDSTAVIDLAAPGLGADYSAGEPVLQYPRLVERIAWILEPEQEEELEARVSHALAAINAIPLGARNGDGEQVEYEQRGEELVVVDVIGQEAVLDGSQIDPDTLPPPVTTDHLRPASSPAAIVQPGIGSLFISWAPIDNADPVTYEVHLSASSGFLPAYGPPTDAGPSTFVTETEGRLVNVRTLPGGIPLVYGTTYYARVWAKDLDGKSLFPGFEAGAAPAQITGPDIAVAQILAEHIRTGEITAEHLQAVMILVGSLFVPAQDGQRVELTPAGIKVVDQSGDDVVVLPSKGTEPARFTGDLTAQTLTIYDRLSMRGAQNVIDGGTLTLSSQLADPRTPPTVAIDPDTVELSGLAPFQAADHVTHRGLFYDPSGYTGTQTIISTLIDNGEIAVFEHEAAAGGVAALLRSTTIGPTVLDGLKWNRVCGVTRRGNIVYVLGWRGGSQLIVTRLRQSDFARLSFHEITLPGQVDPYRSTISSIAAVPGSVFVWSINGTGATEELRRDEYTDNNSVLGAWAHVPGAAPYHGLTFDGQAGGDVIEGHVRIGVGPGSQDWISTDKGGVHGPVAFDTSSRDFVDETGFVSSSQGIAHDGTRFLSRAGARITRHTDWDWSSALRYLIYRYTWRNDAPAQETLTSPERALDVRPDPTLAHRAYRRNRFKITLPTRPSPLFRIYAEHSATSTLTPGSLNRQSTPFISSETSSPTYQIDEDVSGAAPPTVSNTFLGATSTVKSQSPAWELTGSGAKGLLALLSPTAQRRINFGTGTLDVSGASGGTNPGPTVTIAHGLGTTPQIVIATVTSNSTNALIRAYGWDGTNFTLAITHRDTAGVFAAATTVSFAWLAIA